RPRHPVDAGHLPHVQHDRPRLPGARLVQRVQHPLGRREVDGALGGHDRDPFARGTAPGATPATGRSSAVATRVTVEPANAGLCIRCRPSRELAHIGN
ncbi:hypothetical protein, partial [Streptomyces sp. NPDC006510]|uniref:hypothetical protein n=1 Tax=Streptomyces sp. NPDC006510 TaxID=3155600 RepID=UPI0033B35719